MNSETMFRIQNLRNHVTLVGQFAQRGWANCEPVSLLEPAQPCYGPPPQDGAWKAMRCGEFWGGKQQWAYLRGQVRVPAHWKSGVVDLVLRHEARYLERPLDDSYPAGPEGQVFIDGRRVGAIDREHHAIRHAFEPGRTHEVAAVFFAGRAACRHGLEAFGVAWIDTAVEKLYHDLRVHLEMAGELPETSVARERLIRAVEAAVSRLDIRALPHVISIALPGSTTVIPREGDRAFDAFHGSIAAAQHALDEAVAAIDAPGGVPNVVALGHAHIDLAWLWPIKQTRHKCVRTFATQCRLLRQYPRWIFQQSSPQAYQWVEQDAPELFDEIKQLIQAGRWEAEGGTWVEMDTNLPSGESLVRQILYGKRYFREKLGVESRLLWLPDVFGYSAALPQLLRLGGLDSFITSKISWNQYNRFPHDTFRWRGLDGTEIVTQFITTPLEGATFLTYNALLNVRELKQNWELYRQKQNLLDALMTFGYGDGGGGPTTEMIETGLRLAERPYAESIPRVRFEPAGELMRRLQGESDRLPRWEGELYLEYHRGTYTTQAWLKRANRKNEIALHHVEWISTLAAPLGHTLDKAKLDALWQDLLLLQFHDILPGSSVGELYRDEARPMHQRIADETRRMTESAMTAIASQVDTSAFRRPVVLFNTLSWDRTDAVRMPDGAWRTGVRVPAGGWCVIEGQEAPPETADPELFVSDDGRQLRNRFWDIHLDEQGRIASLLDRKAQRQVLAPGAAGNEWQVFEDRPLAHDAWDIDDFYRERRLPGPVLTSLRVVERVAARVAVELRWAMPRVGPSSSTIVQRLALYADNPRIDFETEADWHEHHQLLKVAFPTAVHAHEANYEIQFGHLPRATHRNTSWDVARFECCGHRFVDLGEHGYGVALLNDCKYGHDVLDGVMRLTCIKCAQSPDATADQGAHTFTYALLPHERSLQEAGVVRAAAEMNTPVLVHAVQAHQGALPAQRQAVDCDCEAIVIDTLKPAEAGDGTVLRLYESHGSHARGRIRLAQTFRQARVVNLLEEPAEGGDALEHAGDVLKVSLRPFQVLTVKIN